MVVYIKGPRGLILELEQRRIMKLRVLIMKIKVVDHETKSGSFRNTIVKTVRRKPWILRTVFKVVVSETTILKTVRRAIVITY